MTDPSRHLINRRNLAASLDSPHADFIQMSEQIGWILIDPGRRWDCSQADMGVRNSTAPTQGPSGASREKIPHAVSHHDRAAYGDAEALGGDH